jgi:hypothetical protein
MMKVKKGFTVFKTVNHFPKFKEEFLVKGKIFFVDYYFTSYQTPEYTENIFRKSFYGETNKALCVVVV